MGTGLRAGVRTPTSWVAMANLVSAWTGRKQAGAGVKPASSPPLTHLSRILFTGSGRT